MNQLPAIVHGPGPKPPLRSGATALVPLEPARGPALPQGPLAERFEVQRAGAEARRGFGRDTGPLLEERPGETGFVLAPRGEVLGGAPAQRGSSRLAAQVYAQSRPDAGPEAHGRALAQGSEAYRKAGAEPSLQAEPARLFDLSI
ncbi:MAG: hypothetical protein QNJ30_21955 [Kiloniellales bacterium]|nr:hypothetical protein [Kiloniellales bacterium]